MRNGQTAQAMDRKIHTSVHFSVALVNASTSTSPFTSGSSIRTVQPSESRSISQNPPLPISICKGLRLYAWCWFSMHFWISVSVFNFSDFHYSRCHFLTFAFLIFIFLPFTFLIFTFVSFCFAEFHVTDFHFSYLRISVSEFNLTFISNSKLLTFTFLIWTLERF